MQPSDGNNNLNNSAPIISTEPVQTPPPPVTPPSTSTETEEEKENKFLNPLLILLGVVSIILIVAIVWLIFFNSKNGLTYFTKNQTQIITPTPAPPASISGVINFEGYAPAGSYLAIAARPSGKAEFSDVVSGLVPQSGNIPWDWSDADSGTNYDIKATIKVSGKVIEQSSINSVSAPADTIVLPLVSEQKSPQTTNTSINGNVHLDGYIPAGSYINIVVEQNNSNNLINAVTNLSATDGVNWSWSSAISGQTYQIQANLISSTGSLISSSSLQTLTAPSSNINLAISSTANPPAPAITGISGTININGSIPPNSYITLATRPTGTGTFNQINGNISATDGVSWVWNNANSGQSYDVQAYLWSNGQPYSQSNILTLTAPSANNLLTINAQQQLSAPSGSTINVSCNGQQNGNWQVTINYNTQSNLQNAQSYNLVMTYASQGNQVLNTTLNPANPTQSQSLTTGYIVTTGATYYAQYSYSTSANSANFSPLSPPVQFACQ